MIAAAPIMPYFTPPAPGVLPYPSGANGCRLVALKCGSATATNSASVTILSTTSAVLILALSRVPSISSPATTAMMKTAGKLMPYSVAVTTRSHTLPAKTGPCGNAQGRSTPRPCRNPTAYPDQPTATVATTSEYSRISDQPTTHAITSPKVA